MPVGEGNDMNITESNKETDKPEMAKILRKWHDRKVGWHNLEKSQNLKQLTNTTIRLQ